MGSSALKTGIHVPLITPFTSTGEIALDSLEQLAHEGLDDGAAGLAALGTTAEAATLTENEKAAVLDVVARVCRERGAALMVGAGSNDTAASIRALTALKTVPEAVTALSLVPYFTRPSEAGVIAHFTALATASPVPLVIYHIPYRTGQELSTRALCELGALPNIAGVKYAVGGITAATVKLMATRPADFAVLAGDDVVLSPLLAMGAEGGILASAHVATGAFVTLADAWHAGDGVRAAALGHRLSVLSAALFAEPNPTVIKAVLHAQGRIPTPNVRLPLLPAGPESLAGALNALEALDR
ncbi:dihydrodipicolinate synthase family protein [Streptomyces sp. NPDC086549]|uniref:dihydrodipicolinate synthase family protein n=1 Tax=Streptomyces sp. NPDC086549 TaxID=3365752 RepID=UPI003812CF1B